MKRFLIIMVSIMLMATVSTAQDLISLSGRVQDGANKRALSFASVQLLSTNISNVTNSDGVFVLKIPSGVKADSILISYLGYKSVKYSIHDFAKGELLIRMEQSNITLKPVTVRPQDALSMIRMAVARVNVNYSQKPVQMTAFYREMIKKGNNYVSINEAVLDINKASYAGYRADQIGIFKARGSYDINRIDTLLVKFQGGPNSSLDLDVMKDPFLGVETLMLDQIYSFVFSNPVTIDDRFFYVIEFNEKPGIKEIYFRGKVYIDSESLAVGRVEFSMNVEGRETANAYFIKKKPASLKMDVMSADYLVNYKRNNDGLWYFDYSRTSVKFNAKWD
ncbi:MAG: carboxypeptidase-like regulatory domain-containing protein, partial [Bacteroidales bacterium]|nr:carboxypeptidase-like regulatory domain-containing protein [Bacteroidales bacterium]